MEEFFQRMQVRRDSLKKQTMSKADQWKLDEMAARNGSCEFSVKYLGVTEVNQSKGTDVCGQSFQKLKYEDHGISLTHVFHKSSRRRPSISSHHYAKLQISSGGLRIIDENDDVLVSTPVTRISFCCPNNQHERGFTYICTGEVPWKWYCHAMEAVEDLGERLNHAVGCIFAICLEKKLQQRRCKSVDCPDDDFGTHHSTMTAEQLRKLSISGERQTNVPPGSHGARRSSEVTLPPSIDRFLAGSEFRPRKGSLGNLLDANPYKRLDVESVTEEEIDTPNNVSE